MALKVFVSDGDSYICRSLVKKLRADGHSVVTSVRPSPTGQPAAQGALIDSAAAVQAALDCNVVVLSLLTALSEAETIVEAVRAQAAQFAVGNTDDAASKLDDEEGSASDPPPGYDKTVIAISSTLTWDRSTSMRPPYQEPNYRRRRPGTKSAEVKLAESHVMALGAPERGLRCHVVAAGLPYGDGQGPLLPLFRRAWLCVDAPTASAASAPPSEAAASTVGLPLPCLRDESGANLLPTIHVRDLAAFVAALVVASPAAQQEAGQAEYLVAVDEGRDSLRAIGLAIARILGAGTVRLVPKADVSSVFAAEDAPLRTVAAPSSAVAASVAAAADDSEGLPQGAAPSTAAAAASPVPATGGAVAPAPSARVYFGSDPTLGPAMLALLQAHAHFDTSSLSIFTHPQLGLPDDAWHARGGLVAHMDAVAAEFRLWHDLRPMRIVVLGAPTVGKSHAAAALGLKYHLPVVDARGALATVRTGGNLASLGDGTPEREAALAALREAVDTALGDAEAAAAAVAAAAAAAASTGPPVSGKPAPAAAATAKTTRAKAGGTAAAAAAAAVAAATPEEQAAAAAAADRPARVPRALLVRALRAVLLSPRCRNAGWVLDGFPRTWADADALFNALPEDDDGVTPGPEDAEAQPREEADETALVAAEAAASGVSVVVGDVVVVSPTVREESKDAGGEGGDEEEEEGGEDEEDAAALDHSELLAARELHAGLRPTASLLLNAPDSWLEGRLSSLPPGAASRNHNSRDALHRRLRFSRLHLTTALTRTPVTWLEAHARQEVVPIAVDAVWARAQSRAAAVVGSAADAAASAGDPLAPTTEDDRVATATMLRYLAAVPSAAATWNLSADAVAAAAGSHPILLPGDIPSVAACAFACLASAELAAAAAANERGGRPHNFHPTPEEDAALKALARTRAVHLAAATRAADLQARPRGGAEALISSLCVLV